MEHLYLAHHGILGQKWGERKYQNKDGSLTPAGRLRYLKNNISDKIKLKNTYDTRLTSNIKTSFGKTRYTNIDGTLNEHGKKMVSNFAKHEIDKNNKYYDKYIKKYQKAYDSTNNDTLKKRYKSMIDDAEKSRKTLNDNVGKLSIDNIVSIKNERIANKLKMAGAITGTAGVAGVLAYTNFDPHKMVDDTLEWTRTSTAGRNARKFVDSSLRTAIDGRSYITALFADETIARAQELGTFDRLNSEIGKTSNIVSDNFNVALKRSINTLNEADTSGVNDILNNMNKVPKKSSGAQFL